MDYSAQPIEIEIVVEVNGSYSKEGSFEAAGRKSVYCAHGIGREDYTNHHC